MNPWVNFILLALFVGALGAMIFIFINNKLLRRRYNVEHDKGRQATKKAFGGRTTSGAPQTTSGLLPPSNSELPNDSSTGGNKRRIDKLKESFNRKN